MSEIFVVGNSVDLPAGQDLNGHTSDNQLVFVGKMDYEPNVVATTWFVREIFPVVRKEFPDLKFSIVGARPCQQVAELGREPGVDVTGFVDSVVPFYKQSTIVIAPMLTGAGIQNKIIQAMSYGCCVATTTIGAEGIGLDTAPVMVVDGKEMWIEHLTALLNDRETRKAFGSRARAYVETNLTRDRIRKQFMDFIESPLSIKD